MKVFPTKSNVGKLVINATNLKILSQLIYGRPNELLNQQYLIKYTGLKRFNTKEIVST